MLVRRMPAESCSCAACPLSHARARLRACELSMAAPSQRMDSRTVAELRTEAKRRGLPSLGSRRELVQRLQVRTAVECWIARLLGCAGLRARVFERERIPARASRACVRQRGSTCVCRGAGDGRGAVRRAVAVTRGRRGVLPQDEDEEQHPPPPCATSRRA
jgi:hypothetical protein